MGLLCSIASIAQNDIDAMRYSQLSFGGTARFTAMGGSMGALGGDISTLAFNPAGIAVYRRNEFTFTPSVVSQRTSSTYLGTNSSDSKIKLNLSNIGGVFTMILKDTSSGWKSLHWGVGYNRLNNFQNRIDIIGENNNSSLLDVYVANANGHLPSEFDGFSTGLAWTTYLINPGFSDTTQYYHVIPYYGETQRKSVETSGHMGEFDQTFGGNYRDKLLFGATFGIVRANYDEESVYQEYDKHDSIPYFSSFKLTNKLSSVGTGFNGKFGLLVKPSDWLRLGLAIHTPTVFYFTDHYSSIMNSDLEGGYTYSDSSKDGSFKYNVITPFRAIGSVGFIIKKIAIINAEYEYIDYSSAQLTSHPNVFTDVNTGIRSKYTSTGNIRVGAEVRLDPIAFRVGYALYGSPFKSGDNTSAYRSSYTAGIGYRINNFSLDFAYVLGKYSETGYLYDPSISKSYNNDYKSSNFLLTMGIRF